jgi:hypothetical protein
VISVLVLMCMVSQGHKGTYPTVLMATGHDAKYFYATSGGQSLKDLKSDMLRIERKKCRVIAVRKVEEL